MIQKLIQCLVIITVSAIFLTEVSWPLLERTVGEFWGGFLNGFLAVGMGWTAAGFLPKKGENK